MKQDAGEQMRMVSADSVPLVTFATKMFIGLLSHLAWSFSTKRARRNTLQEKDLMVAVAAMDKADFLIDLLDILGEHAAEKANPDGSASVQQLIERQAASVLDETAPPSVRYANLGRQWQVQLDHVEQERDEQMPDAPSATLGDFAPQADMTRTIPQFSSSRACDWPTTSCAQVHGQEPASAMHNGSRGIPNISGSRGIVSHPAVHPPDRRHGVPLAMPFGHFERRSDNLEACMDREPLPRGQALHAQPVSAFDEPVNNFEMAQYFSNREACHDDEQMLESQPSLHSHASLHHLVTDTEVANFLVDRADTDADSPNDLLGRLPSRELSISLLTEVLGANTERALDHMLNELLQ
jgi:hypothetical protein